SIALHQALFGEENFTIRLLRTFDRSRQRVESAMGRALEGWAVRRLTSEDGAVLRLGVTEILLMEDVPARVAINEYVDLAKIFGDKESPGLVNGVLDRVMRDNPREKAGVPAE